MQNIDQTADDEKVFDRRLTSLKRELESGEYVPQHEKLYKQYFTWKTTPKRGTLVFVREESIIKAKRSLKRELESGEYVPQHEKLYKQYFTWKTTPKRGTLVFVREESIIKAKRYFGFFALISNETMDAITALELCRNKDVVEKAFGNLKERLNMRRTLVSSELSPDGKLFVQFVALIYLSHIKKQMQEKDLVKRYSITSLLDKL
ncbi:hypothetical protein [Methanospirillum sp.]|uniref:hypothetical protein n=1 Tax=Methanospirillum sp. TaxID=45200 RepID=UPI00359FD2B5